MKKLMTMLSAVALAFGLRAEADTGTSFEGMAAGPLDTASMTGELVAGAEDTSYWSGTSENCEATVVADVSVSRDTERPGVSGEYLYPDHQFGRSTQERYLEVKTTFGNPLMRKAKTSGMVELAGSFYVDSLVKFTIFDTAPTFEKDGSAVYDGAKLAIWLQENDEDNPTATNLFIRAGYVGGEAKTYDCGSFMGDPTAWHRVTVKAIENIYKSGNGVVPGFVVFIDNMPQGSTDTDNGIDATKVADAYAKFLQAMYLFPSMDLSSDNARNLEGILFDGQGSVDDIAFTATVPFDAARDDALEYVTLAWDAHVTGLTYKAGDADAKTLTATELNIGSVKISYSKGSTVALSVTGITYEEGWMGDATLTATLGGDTLSAKIDSVKAAAKFGDTSYATVEEAFNAAKTATTAGTFKLFANYTVKIGESEVSELTFENSADVTFDLAGHTLTGDICSTVGLVIIIDSSPAGTGVVDGIVCVYPKEDGGNPGTLEIRGGKYLAVDSDGYEMYEGGIADIEGFATPGKIFELVDNYYVLTTPKVAKIGNTKYETLAGAFAAASYGDTVEMIDNVEFNEPLVVSAYSCTLDLATFNLTWTGAGTTYPIVISNGTLTIQATVTNETDVAGSIVKTVGDATLIRVGLPASGADPDAEGYVPAAEGTLTIEGGTFKNYGSNVIKVEKGSLTMNGGTVENAKDGARGLRAAKATGVTEIDPVSITVNGGTIIATTPLDIEPEGHGTISVPGDSTAKFSADVSAFCATGYETVLKDGFYVVQATGSEPGINPVNPGDTAYETADAAAAAAAAINADKEAYINLPAGAESIDKAAYTSMFAATASGVTVTVALTPAATAEIQAQVDDEVKKVDVKAVAAAAGESLTQAIKTTPGLFYSVIAGDTLTGMTVKSCTLATGSETTVTLPKFAGKGFYKIQATVAPVTPVGQ